jgi:hypothetical protein
LAKRAAAFPDLDQWTLLTGVTLINLAGLRFSNDVLTRRWTSGICIFQMVIAATGTFAQYRQMVESVVTGSETRLLLSPFPPASSVKIIQKGRKVH